MQLGPDDHQPDGPREHLLRSAGKPFPWIELRVVDPVSGEDVAAGTVGEVWLRGPNVMAGYYDLPAETSAAITADGWLRTGDGGYLDDEGYLFLTDRVKDMIVSGGENVYPIEVEEALSQHPGVAEAAVVGVPRRALGRDGQGVRRPEPERRATPRADRLRARATRRLQGAAQFEFVAELPRTPTGKVLKRALVERSVRRAPARALHRTPADRSAD